MRSFLCVLVFLDKRSNLKTSHQDLGNWDEHFLHFISGNKQLIDYLWKLLLVAALETTPPSVPVSLLCSAVYSRHWDLAAGWSWEGCLLVPGFSKGIKSCSSSNPLLHSDLLHPTQPYSLFCLLHQPTNSTPSHHSSTQLKPHWFLVYLHITPCG